MDINQDLRELTKGRPFAFMIMPFKTNFAMFRTIKTFVETTHGLTCLRADDLKASGHDLKAKIHAMIERSEFVIAEISPSESGAGYNPNVFYEVGYASAIKKTVLVIIKEGYEVPTDLKGLEIIRYADDRERYETFEEEVKKHIKTRLATDTALLRDMLLADQPRPSIVVASPKNANRRSTNMGQARDRYTFGDNIGILGLISAFGTMLGENTDVDLVSGRFYAPEIDKTDANLYVLGSSKVNRLSGRMLRIMQKDRPIRYRLGPCVGGGLSGDYPVGLYRQEGNHFTLLECESDDVFLDGRKVKSRDHGIIVRGPHPLHPNRTVMVIAGPRSLGTGAACMAATNSSLILQIQKILQAKNISLSDKSRTIFVHVRGTLNIIGRHLTPDRVEILDAGEL
ncbi:MAG: hypothetical protein P4L46_26450 [Fimbriimonas sp.]|nr:hypothetical protein [Fimbriimonas sp.]